MSEISLPEPRKKPGKLARVGVAAAVAVGGAFAAGKALNEKNAGEINPVKGTTNVAQVEQIVNQEQADKDIYLQRAYRYLHQGKEVNLYDISVDPTKMSVDVERQIELVFSPAPEPLRGQQAFKNIAKTIQASLLNSEESGLHVQDSAFVPRWVLAGESGPQSEEDNRIGFLPIMAGDIGIGNPDNLKFYRGYVFLRVNLDRMIPGVGITPSGQDIISDVRGQVRILQNTDTESKAMGSVSTPSL